jgi:hypothetical protein
VRGAGTTVQQNEPMNRSAIETDREIPRNGAPFQSSIESGNCAMREAAAAAAGHRGNPWVALAPASRLGVVRREQLLHVGAGTCACARIGTRTGTCASVRAGTCAGHGACVGASACIRAGTSQGTSTGTSTSACTSLSTSTGLSAGTSSSACTSGGAGQAVGQRAGGQQDLRQEGVGGEACSSSLKSSTGWLRQRVRQYTMAAVMATWRLADVATDCLASLPCPMHSHLTTSLPCNGPSHPPPALFPLLPSSPSPGQSCG